MKTVTLSISNAILVVCASLLVGLAISFTAYLHMPKLENPASLKNQPPSHGITADALARNELYAKLPEFFRQQNLSNIHAKAYTVALANSKECTDCGRLWEMNGHGDYYMHPVVARAVGEYQDNVYYVVPAQVGYVRKGNSANFEREYIPKFVIYAFNRSGAGMRVEGGSDAVSFQIGYDGPWIITHDRVQAESTIATALEALKKTYHSY